VKKAILACSALGGMALLSAAILAAPHYCGQDDGIAFQILTDKPVYTPGETMRVKFLTTNTSEPPLYLDRYVPPCKSTVGFVTLQLLDRKGQDVRSSECSGETRPLNDSEILPWIETSAEWIVLKQRETYGNESGFRLPAKRGTYRLKSELYPTPLTPSQLAILSQNHLRVSQCVCQAPVVTITVK